MGRSRREHTHTHTLPLHTSRTHGRHSRCSCLTAPSPRWHRMCGLACFVREMCDSVDSACSPRVLRLTVGIHVNVGNTARARYNVFSHSLHPLCSRSRRHADGHCLQGPPRTTDDRCVSVTPVGAGGCVGPLARTRSVPSTVALSRPCRSACIHTQRMLCTCTLMLYMCPHVSHSVGRTRRERSHTGTETHVFCPLRVVLVCMCTVRQGA